MDTSTRVAIYGSSLFLTAVIAVLRYDAAITLIQSPPHSTAQEIIKQAPSFLVYQDFSTPPNRQSLLEAGIQLLKVDSQQSTITIYQNNKTNQQHLINESADLVAVIAQGKSRGAKPHV